MGRERLCGAAAVVLAVAVLLGAAGAGQARSSGAGGSEVQAARTTGYLSLGKEKGYRLALYMPTDRIVVFYGVKAEQLKHERYVVRYSIYAARNLGNLERGVVRARFGSFGRVSLRFRPSGRVRRSDPGPECEGGSETAESGRFVGRLNFRGKSNYFHVSSAGGGALIEHAPRLLCEKGEAEEALPRSLRRYVALTPLFPDDDSIALLYASSRSHGRYVGITAEHLEGAGPGAEVQLAIVEPRHGVAIGHGVYLEGPAGTLLTSPPGAHPATAALAPSAPFSGKAAYSEESGAWTGTLGVKLAGFTVPLTGAGFHVHLCVINPIKDRNGCEFFKAELPPDERPARPTWVLR